MAVAPGYAISVLTVLGKSDHKIVPTQISPAPSGTTATHGSGGPAAIGAKTGVTPAAVPAQVLVRCADPDTGLASLLTGLAMLEQQGRIRLAVEIVPAPPPRQSGPWYLRDKARTHAEMIVDGQKSAYLDIHDSWEIDFDALSRHDLYFKRSLRSDVRLLAEGHKIQPLGLLSNVRGDGIDPHEITALRRLNPNPVARARARARRALNVAAARFGYGNRPNFSRLHARPTPGQHPRVLFMAGLWNPAMVPDSDPAKRAEFAAINAMRADCVRALRREFGPLFYGGVRHDDFSRANFADVLLPDAHAGDHREFILRAREHAICVTSMGLHGSNGWRLAEFVALSRAIVSEPLQYDVPGPFRADIHYLEYQTPQQCVEAATWLFAHVRERDEMMQSNWAIYQDWVRPDRLAGRLVELTRVAGTVAAEQEALPSSATTAADGARTYQVPMAPTSSGT